MKIIPKYAKAFWPAIMLSVIFIAGHCIADLSLPDLMSKIVNTGIQSHGIESAAPALLTDGSLDMLQLLLGPDERARIESRYKRVSASDTDENSAKTYGELYPGAGGSLLVLNTSDKAALEELELAMGTAAWTLVRLAGTLMPEGGLSAKDDTQAASFDTDTLDTLLPALARLPESAVAEARAAAASADDMLRNASGILLTRALYEQAGMDLAAVQRGYILRTGFWMLLLALGSGLAVITVSYISSRVASGISRKLRSDVFEKVSLFSGMEFDRFSTASLITRTTNDITQVQMLFGMGLRMVFAAPIMAAGGVVMAVRKSPSMSWLIAAACLLLMGMMAFVFFTAMPKFKLMQKLTDKLNLVSREGLTGLLVIRAFGTQKHEQGRFDEANRNVADTMLFISRVTSAMLPMMMLIMNAMAVMIIWLGAHQIEQASMQVGDMMAFIQYAMQIVMSFLMLSMMFIMIPRAAVSAERIREVLDTEPQILDPLNPIPFDPMQKGVAEFKNVSFKYPGAEENTLTDISFRMEPGKTTAIIGSTGSGKSTLISLLLRFYDVTEGSLTVDGAEVSKVRQADLRARIGYVPQKGVLMTGDIRSNLAYGRPDASGGELEEAASIAQALDFILEKPGGFSDPISQGGTNVSGGQKQRLSIARALAKKPEILIFDDSFSALDFQTDLALRRALKEKASGASVLVVAQRVNTIQNAEQIIVLEQGRIAGIGSHLELLNSCPEYYEIASSQLSEEELSSLSVE